MESFPPSWEGGFWILTRLPWNMLGYSKDELRKLAYQQLTPIEWHESDADIISNQVLARGYSNVSEKKFIRKDGTAFPVSIRVWLMKNGQEQHARTRGIVPGSPEFVGDSKLEWSLSLSSI